jgi:hypothetical protein
MVAVIVLIAFLTGAMVFWVNMGYESGREESIEASNKPALPSKAETMEANLEAEWDAKFDPFMPRPVKSAAEILGEHNPYNDDCRCAPCVKDLSLMEKSYRLKQEIAEISHRANELRVKQDQQLSKVVDLENNPGLKHVGTPKGIRTESEKVYNYQTGGYEYVIKNYLPNGQTVAMRVPLNDEVDGYTVHEYDGTIIRRVEARPCPTPTEIRSYGYYG